MRPSDTDDLPHVPGEPEGWHVREKTEDGYPLMGSSPAERADSAERTERIRRNAMRDHPFEGDGPHCRAWISFAPMGGPDTGRITGQMGCGYPPEAHPEPTFPNKRCATAGDHTPHIWLETNIPTGNPLVRYTQWWQCGGLA